MNYKGLGLWLVVGLVMILIFTHFSTVKPRRKRLIFSDFINKVGNGEVTEVTIKRIILWENLRTTPNSAPILQIILTL